MKKRVTKKFSKENISKFFRGRKRRILLIVIFALIIFRLFLPLIVKNYVNRVLSRIPGYHGWVDDIDISLYRGAYTINGLHLFKNGNKKPMLDFPESDISIEWRSLFKGRIVSKIRMYRPAFNIYVTANKLSEKQTPGQEDWTHALKKLVPIKINKLIVENGEFLYADIIESPDINLAIHQIDLVATNMSNVVDKKEVLPSDVTINAVSLGKGKLNVTAKLNLLRKIPNMDVNVSLKNSDVTALNSLTLATAGFDFERGQFELYSEFAVKNDYLKGYVKPMFHKIRILDSVHKTNSSIFKRIWEGAITFFGFILKNKPHDSFATKVPVEGKLSDPDFGIWKLITNIFVNAFIRPFQSKVDEDIQYSDIGGKKKRSEKKKEKEK